MTNIFALIFAIFCLCYSSFLLGRMYEFRFGRYKILHDKLLSQLLETSRFLGEMQDMLESFKQNPNVPIISPIQIKRDE